MNSTPKRESARPEPDDAGSQILREHVYPRFVRTGWYWGPECPIIAGHGAMLDIKGTDRWYCRHQYHDVDGTRAVFSEEELVDLEFARLIAVAESPELPISTPLGPEKSEEE